METVNLPLEAYAKLRVVKVVTPREFEVLRLLAQNKSSEVVSRELMLSVKTVSAYRDKLKRKLGLAQGNSAAFVLYGIRHGLCTVDLVPEMVGVPAAEQRDVINALICRDSLQHSRCAV